jgi:hypothetical protein
MPGTGYDSTLGPAAFRIVSGDAKLAGLQGATVTTTLSWLAEHDSLDRAAIVQNVIRPNIELLRANHVPILVGSDIFRETPAGEADILASLKDIYKRRASEDLELGYSALDFPAPKDRAFREWV